MALAGALLIVIGAAAPWAEGRARFSAESVVIYGVYRPEGQLAFVLGLLALAMTVLGTRWWARPSVTPLMVLPFVVPAVIGIYLWLDFQRLRIGPGGAVPIEGWVAFERRWGAAVVAFGGLIGLLVVLHMCWKIDARPRKCDARRRGQPRRARA